MGILGKLFGGGSPSSADRTEEVMGKYLDNDFKIFPMAEKKADVAQVAAAEKQAGVRYPREFVAHLCGRFPGVFVEVKESIWPRSKEFEVAPFWSFLRALHTFTPAPDSEPWMRLADAAVSFQEHTGLMAAPILKIMGDADLYCVDPHGELVQFLHEESRLEPVRLDFWQLFEREIRELAERKARKKSGK